MFWHKGTLEEPRPVVGGRGRRVDRGQGRAALGRPHRGARRRAGADPSQRHLRADGCGQRQRPAWSSRSSRARTARARQASLQVGDGEERRKLTEPMALFNGLGFQFWEPPVPAVIAKVEPGSPAAEHRPAQGRSPDRSERPLAARLLRSARRHLEDQAGRRAQPAIRPRRRGARALRVVLGSRPEQLVEEGLPRRLAGAAEAAAGHDRHHDAHAVLGARRRRLRSMGHDAAPGASRVAHGDGQRLAEEPQRPAVDRRVRGRVRERWRRTRS